jgi:hypothetical protein
MNFRAILLDWRGTLALTPSEPQWIQEGLRRLGDRAAFDGAAVAVGMVTLLLPPLRSVTDCRLHFVTALLG